jgi:hypothetical protein
MMPPAMTWTGVVLLALAAWAVARLFWGYGPRDAAYPQLSAHEQVFLRAASNAVFPPGGAIPYSGPEAGALRHVDRFLALIAPRTRFLMRLLFFLMEHATLFFPAPGWDGFRRFSALSPEQQQAALEGWARSPLVARRTIFQSLRAILTMAYFGDPAVLRTIGLAPLAMETPVVDADLLYPPIGQPKSAIRFGVADKDRPWPTAPLDLRGPLAPGYQELR